MAETGPGFWYVIFWAMDQKLNEIPLPFCDNSRVRKLAESMTRSEQTPSEIDIPLVRAAFAEPFRLAMRRNGLDADAWFRRCRLPLVKLEDPASLLPVKPFWQLVNRVAIEENIADFGMQVAQAKPWFEITTMRQRLEIQPDLGSLLAEFCQIAEGQSSNVAFAVNTVNGVCRFEYLLNPPIVKGIHMEIYRITSMIELVQVITGKRWRPQAVSLLMAESGIVDQVDILSGLEIRFARPYTAIHFPEALLETLRTEADKAVSISRSRIDRDDNIAMRTDLISALREILGNYVTEEYLSIDLIADLAGLTSRSLQRAIKARGTSYRDLLNDARRDYALEKLRQPDVGIHQIANYLGYREAGHFTRAFKRWTGMTPSEYRKLDSSQT
jgi:AraC-like DNA-binding protein